jgi:hypothetical protein
MYQASCSPPFLAPPLSRSVPFPDHHTPTPVLSIPPASLSSFVCPPAALQVCLRLLHHVAGKMRWPVWRQ